MGYWIDMKDPYITYDNKYIETLWHLLAELYKKGLLYKGYTIQPYSPAAGTGLSNHELNQPGCYRDVKDTTCTALFRIVRDQRSERLFDGADGDVYFMAWTTTPWTLPSNTALAVGPAIRYVRSAVVQSLYGALRLPSFWPKTCARPISRRRTKTFRWTATRPAAKTYRSASRASTWARTWQASATSRCSRGSRPTAMRSASSPATT